MAWDKKIILTWLTWPFAGHIKFRGVLLPKVMLTGIVAVIFLYVGVAGIISTTLPFDINKGDTRAHIDYVWRVYNGDIPRLDDGIQYKPFNETGDRAIQPQANHPPLFYAINVPFVGPLLERGDWKKAIAIARYINIFIGVLCILALAWAGWLYGSKRRAVFAVALPAIAVLAYRFVTLNVVYGADALLLLISTLTFVAIYKIIKNGLNKKYAAWLAVLSVAGMATKAGYFAILVTSFVALIVAAFLRAKRERKRQILRAVGLIAVIILLIIAVLGWFYYVRNFQTSGTWFRATPDEYSGGREYKSLVDVILSGKLRALFYEEFAQNAPLSIAITSFATAGLLGIKRLNVKKALKNKLAASIVAVLLVAVLGVLASQVAFAVGYGAINFRYMLPALVPIGLFLTYGLLRFEWARGQMLAGAAILSGLTAFFPAVSVIPEPDKAKVRLNSLLADASYNNVPHMVILALLALFFIGAVTLIASLYKLSAKSGQDM